MEMGWFEIRYRQSESHLFVFGPGLVTGPYFSGTQRLIEVMARLD